MAPRTSNEPRMMRRFMLCLRRPRLYGGSRLRAGSRFTLFVVLPIHPAPEEPACKRSEPAEHVVHVAEVHQLDEIAVEIPAEEKRMTARRSLGTADALHTFAEQVVVPPLQVAYVERDVREPDTVPRNRDRRLLRLELEDFEHPPAGHADPADFAGRCIRGDLKERTHALGRGVGNADQWTTEDLPVELHRAVEARNSDPGMADRSRLHERCV